jgi:hypothetical protein
MTEKTRFVIIANPRTGTNHLIDLLNSHQDITCHREVFHRDAVYLLEGTRTDLLEKRNEDPIAFLRELYDTSPTRACGFKIFMNHNDTVLETVLRDTGIKKIVLFRPNHLAVYSSGMIASAEKRFLIMEDTRNRIDSGAKDKPRNRAKVIFDRQGFELHRRAYQLHYRYVIEVLNETNQNYLFLTYEDYLNESLFRRVFPFLELSQPHILHTRMKKMNTNDILSRFKNPDDVGAYLKEIGKENWAHEAFMLWSQPAESNKPLEKMSSKSVDDSTQNEKMMSDPGGHQQLAAGLARGTGENQTLNSTLSETQKLPVEHEQEITELERKLVKIGHLLEQREIYILEREAHIRAILESRSWRVTKPLRRAYEIMLKLKQ